MHPDELFAIISNSIKINPSKISMKRMYEPVTKEHKCPGCDKIVKRIRFDVCLPTGQAKCRCVQGCRKKVTFADLRKDHHEDGPA